MSLTSWSKYKSNFFFFFLLRFIIYQVLQSHEVSEDKPPVNVKKNVKRVFRSKASKKVSSEESSDSSDSKGDEEEEEEEVKPRKKSIPKGKMQKSDLTKRKKPAKETNVSNKKPRKAGETISEDNSDAEDSGHVSEDDNSQSSPEKPVKVIFLIFPSP